MVELPEMDVKGKVSSLEWQTRVELAACYRLLAMLGWDDLIYIQVKAVGSKLGLQ